MFITRHVSNKRLFAPLFFASALHGTLTQAAYLFISLVVLFLYRYTLPQTFTDYLQTNSEVISLDMHTYYYFFNHQMG